MYFSYAVNHESVSWKLYECHAFEEHIHLFFLDDDPSFSVKSGTRNADWCHSPYRHGTKFVWCNIVRQEGGG